MRSQGCQKRASEAFISARALDAEDLRTRAGHRASFVLPSICLHLGLMADVPGVKTLVNPAFLSPFTVGSQWNLTQFVSSSDRNFRMVASRMTVFRDSGVVQAKRNTATPATD